MSDQEQNNANEGQSRAGEAGANLTAGLAADYDFEMASTPPDKGGETLCGRLGRPHKMIRHGPMKTACIYPGCDAVC